MNFMKWIPAYFTLSAIVIGVGLYSMVVWGFQFSIGFTGGSLVEVRFAGETPSSETVESTLKDFYQVESVVYSPSNNTILIKGESIDDAQFAVIEKSLATKGQFELVRFESVGPVVSGELIQKTIAAIVLVSLIILAYVGWQFKELRFGVSAVLAMFHDTLVLLGVFSLLGHFFGIEIDVLFVTAVLTTLSFSVHDTIVVFHRIQELRVRFPRAPLADVLNAAVTETLSRSINNSVTIILMLLSLTLLGGESLFSFSLALLIGAITGTYSSTFIAVPLLLVWHKIEVRLGRRKAPKKIAAN